MQVIALSRRRLRAAARRLSQRRRLRARMFRDRLDWDVWVGAPRLIGKTMTLAGVLPVTASALAAIRATVGLDGPLLADARPLRVAA